MKQVDFVNNIISRIMFYCKIESGLEVSCKEGVLEGDRYCFEDKFGSIVISKQQYDFGKLWLLQGSILGIGVLFVIKVWIVFFVL